MRLAEDYLRLRAAFRERRDGVAFGVSMERIAQALFCTPRNAKLILAKWAELGWVRFASGRGRGHMSQLSFLMPAASLVLEEAKELAGRGDVRRAFDWLKAHEEAASVRPQFLEWLIASFGYRTETVSGDRVIETLRLPIYRDIVSLDPLEALYSFDTHLVQHIFSRLVEYDAETGRIARGVAHHWESSEDASEWTFYLYKGVRFHNGQEMTAEDVRASFERMRGHSYAHRWLTDGIAAIEPLSRYSIAFRLKKPNRLFPLAAAYSGASIIPSGHSPESGGEPLPIGSGPYRVAERRAGICVLESFPSYFGNPAIIDRIEIVIVPENEAGASFGSSAGVLTVVTGEFDVPAVPDYPLKRTVTGVVTMTLNARKDGPLQDEALRKALARGIDRGRMAAELGEPRAHPANGFRLEPNPDGEDRSYRPLEASELLSRSNYGGETLHLYTFARHAADAAWLQAQYRELGVRIEVHVVSLAELAEPTLLAAADMILFEAVLSEGQLRLLEYLRSERSFLRSALHPDTARRIDDCVEEHMRQAESPSDGRRLEAVERILQDSNSAVFLVTKAVRTIYDSSLQGVRVNGRGWVDFDKVWFKAVSSDEGKL